MRRASRRQRAAREPSRAMATAPSKIVEKKDFPAGLGVLVVDDDLLCLKVVEKMLKACKYKGATDGARALRPDVETTRRRKTRRRERERGGERCEGIRSIVRGRAMDARTLARGARGVRLGVGPSSELTLGPNPGRAKG